MKFLPLLPGYAWPGRGARFVRDPIPRPLAVQLPRPGARVRFPVRGQYLGLVFARHSEAGVVEVRVPGRRVVVDLHTPQAGQRLVELPLPPWPCIATVTLADRAGSPAQDRAALLRAAYVTDCAMRELPDRLRAHVERPAFEGAQLNQLTDVFKWYDADWLDSMKQLNATPPYEPPDFVHRKAWEWVQTVYGLDQLGMIGPDIRALGVGVGWEPLSYFFSNHLREVVATDLYPVADEWSDREGNPKILEDPDSFAPYPYRKDRVTFLRMDGQHLAFPDGSFDVVWSCSSIEHFGGHSGAALAMREIERVLAPGGVALVITEYVLPNAITGAVDDFDWEYFNLRCVYDYLVRPVASLRLVQPLDLNFPSYYRRRVVQIPQEGQEPHGPKRKPHIALRGEAGAEITSIALFLRKRGERRRA